MAKSYTAADRLRLIQEQARTGAPLRSFCAAHGLTTATFCAWKRRYETEGAAGLEPRPNPRNSHGAHRGRFTADQRREAVEAWLRSGMRKADFAALWGVGANSLA
ncbi:MAG: helix-turn-helix domain containing protein [Planctomycetes bacterium]|nr:helix-turn-helix domain containing protein [Planctomycetota bacterium]MBL7008878.1 helix-turn-helix domain containing protein [Planctomycetota bacterium]